ncbi:MAG TPA: peptidylprolyl isomerase [Ramlibacter sp.]
MIKSRAAAFALACAVQALALLTPAAAQGLRPSPAPAASAAPQAADYIVAVVNSEPITNGEVRARMARFAQEMTDRGQPLPPRQVFEREVLERLISEKAQLQVAHDNGVKVEDALLDQAEQQVARNNQLTVPELHRRMESQGMSARQFRADLRDQLMLQRLRDHEFESKGKVTEIEIDQFLAQEEAAAQDPNNIELNLAHILVAVPENASEAQVAQIQAKAQQVLQRARAGEDFAKLGQEFPDGRPFGGTGVPVGLRPVDRLPPLFVQAVQNVPEGGVSNLVRSAAGFHIVKLFERRHAGLPGAVVTQTHVRHILLRPGPKLTEAQAVQQLADFKRRIVAGQADFAALAHEYSQDATALNGGDLGWTNPGLFVPEFEEAMNALAPGQIADPVITRFGVHLIQVLGRRQQKLTKDEIREIARNALREKKIEEAYVDWAQEVRGRAYVEYREPPR